MNENYFFFFRYTTIIQYCIKIDDREYRLDAETILYAQNRSLDIRYQIHDQE